MTDTILAIVIAAMAAVPGVYAIYQQRRKTSAEAAEIYEQIAAKSGERIDRLTVRIEALERENEAYRHTLEEWRAGITELHCQIKAGGQEPVWTPPVFEPPTQPRKAAP